eukprot:SAG22_NODE_1042_length_5883_cov_129.108575_3_plen_112_part_00
MNDRQFVDVNLTATAHTPLTSPVAAFTVDFAELAAASAAAGKGGGGGSGGGNVGELLSETVELSFSVTATGVLDAVATWFELDFAPFGGEQSSGRPLCPLAPRSTEHFLFV